MRNVLFGVVLAPPCLSVLFLGLMTSPAAAQPRIPVLNWEKRSDWVNVKTDVIPAAVGDGVADDTAAIQKALDGVDSGSSVYLPPGTYRITDTLALHEPRRGGVLTGVLIVGHGRDTRLVWDGKAEGTMFSENCLSHGRLVGMIFDGRGKAAVGLYHDHGLTEAIRKNEFLKSQNITTGGDYLKAWLACLIKDPFQPLPFLATVGGEDSGKSTLHESVNEFLFTKGVVSGNFALTESGCFNGILEGALLVYIEELNLNRNPTALTRLKEWTTARRLPIRRMRTDVYHVASTCHFFYACNDYAFIPALPGDTRIIVVTVNRPANLIPKKKLMEDLEKQAKYFLATLKELKLPEQKGRLRLPLVETDEKAEIQENNSPLSAFYNECCVVEHNARVKRGDLFAAYEEWRIRDGHKELSASEIGKQLQTLTCGRIKRTTIDGAGAYKHLRLKA